MKTYRAKRAFKSGGQFYWTGNEVPAEIGESLGSDFVEMTYMPDPEEPALVIANLGPAELRAVINDPGTTKVELEQIAGQIGLELVEPKKMKKDDMIREILAKLDEMGTAEKEIEVE